MPALWQNYAVAVLVAHTRTSVTSVPEHAVLALGGLCGSNTPKL